MGITDPARLWSRDEITARSCPVPATPGVYGWYFREIPPLVPTGGCLTHRGLTLLYVGISPRKPSKKGKASGNNLQKRLRGHMRGNASGSTLRLTLGCLLADRLMLKLRPVGPSRRLTWGPGEDTLSEWMSRNAFVTWTEHPEPWVIEEKLIRELALPLNLQGNDHPFRPALTRLRTETKARARRRR